ncbi:MAG: SDR family oxidoreductase [Flavobacteriales bacterium]|nr:SDR family oxidoreductase [Flavobacteriales bacterium]MDW8431155.1 SDR family oxidoreductase [Flavobacteriales bacterium]
MKVLVIGASGLVGGQCFRLFSAQPGFRVAGSYFSFPLAGLSCIDTLRAHALFRWADENFVPDLILQCGALTHVDYCESHPEESFQKTVVAHRHVLEFSRQCGAKVVLFSSDYVFDGRSGPYVETDPVNPLSVYGKHKRLTEEETLAHSSRHLVLRITNVYGREVRGKNFVARILDQIQKASHIHLRLPVDQYSTPVDAADVAAATLMLVRAGQAGLFHIAGTDFMNRVELALTVLRTLNYERYTLEALPTQALGQAAPRPLLGGLIAQAFKNLFPEFAFGTVRTFVEGWKKSE